MFENFFEGTTKLIDGITNEVLATVIVVATMYSYYAGVVIPTEPIMVVLGFYFGKKLS